MESLPGSFLFLFRALDKDPKTDHVLFQLMGHIPGFVTFIEPATAIGGSLPPSWFNLGLGFTWARRKYCQY